MRRLIEHRLPLEEISKQSAREKSIRHGHISTLHIWWARRPLAASRAAVFATLVGDTDQNYALLDTILPKKPDGTRYTREEFETHNAGIKSEAKKLKPERLSLVDWDSSLDPELLEPARKAILESHKQRLVEAGEISADTPLDQVPRPKVLDCFAGGGAIPLEALCLGCDAYALDLNPVAHIIQLATLDYPQRFGQPNSRPVPDYIKAADAKAQKNGLFEGSLEQAYLKNPLAADVRYWGNWVLEKAREELAEFYPKDPDGATPVAYLWARTVKCTNPTCSCEIPMMRQFWLAKKDKKKIALKPVVDREAKHVSFEIVEDVNGSWPDEGTMSRGDAKCPVCGTITPVETIRQDARDGVWGERLLAVVLTRDGETKSYRVSNSDDLAVFDRAKEHLSELQANHVGAISLVPNEELPPVGALGFRVQNYGLKTWGSLFNTRQALALVTFAAKVRETILEVQKLHGAEYSRAVGTCLGITIGKISDYSSNLCRWNVDEFVVAMNGGKNHIAMVWDYAESTPINESSGSYSNALDWVIRVIGNNAHAIGLSANCVRGSATQLPFDNNFFDVVVTDPPYYDAFPYSDLSDFFYVWFRRTIGGEFPNHFRTPLTPKTQEAVQNPIRHNGDNVKAKVFFEEMMSRAFSEMNRSLKPSGIATIVFAHKSTVAWETLINALIRSGFRVESSWPLKTERPGRTRANNSAALESSIFLTCQKRPVSAGIGMYKQVREEMESSIMGRLQEFWDSGIRGADFFFSAIGPGLTAYSKHTEVKRLDGRVVTVGEFLDDVRAISLRFVLSRVLNTSSMGGIDEPTQFYLLALWGYGPELPADEARKLAQSMGVEIADLERVYKILRTKGDKTTLLEVKDRAKSDRLGQPAHEGAPVLLVDALHLAQHLYRQQDLAAIAAYLRDSQVLSQETFWQLAQALSDVLGGEGDGRELQALLALREKITALSKVVGKYGDKLEAANDIQPRLDLEYPNQTRMEDLQGMLNTSNEPVPAGD